MPGAPGDAIWQEAADRAFGPLRHKTYASSGRAFTILIGALVAIGSIVAGAVLLSQDLTVTTQAVDADVVFAEGDDYSAINDAGFATLTLAGDATSATLLIAGVPGAASVLLGDVLALDNQAASQAYEVTIVRSAAPPAAVTELTFLVQTAADVTIISYDAATAATSSLFSIPANTVYDITIVMSIADGTGLGTLGSIDLTFELEPT